ncbi:LysR family transcriptional regulator [Bradyrhizobium sp. WSM 1704]|uniref:LysR family transcriptional regulator n=1 Tax=Bradyrhizobium semiaridum TaxID=2821404 RepID=UPI001CE2A6AA|nr:LysR family transcriptional regulator [Bradyrhizobium semiaridum]MCA6121262.1 LysR family transcriptional regulator [Bradyrhizobium semiaridum]
MNHVSLRYFIEVADCGSIRQAAQRLHVAASAVSRQIANLEHDLQAELIERGPGGVTLTAAGVLVAEQGRSMFRGFDRIRSLVDDLKQLRRGRLDIFCVEGLATEFLPRAIAAFHNKYPDVSYQVITAPTDRIAEALLQDECDFGITINLAARPEIKVVACRTEKVHAIVSRLHPLAARDSITLQEASGYPAAMLLGSFGVRQLLDQAFARCGVTPRQLMSSNSVAAIKGLVLEGAAIAFMSPSLIRRELEEGSLLAKAIVTTPQTAYRLELCVHNKRHLSFAARAMLDALAQQLR